jgi:DNA-binding IclR family transcriptional regulator
MPGPGGSSIVSNSADGRSVTSKLAAILRTFSTGSVHSLSGIARSANLPVSTTHRLTAELAEWGFLERTNDKRYRVGTLVTYLGTRVWHEPNLHEHARRLLDDLSSATRATVRLGVLEDLAVSYIEKRPDTHAVPMSFEPRTLPAHATAMGKALLAFAPEETVEEVIHDGLEQYTPFTIVSAPALRRALAVARMTRVATTRQELRLNTAAVAVPVVAGGGAVVAALELTTVGSGHQLHLIQSAVVVAARALSRELTASQRRSPDRITVLSGSAVTALRGMPTVTPDCRSAPRSAV